MSLEPNKLYLGDCLDIMPNIPDKSIDMILCDLPYRFFRVPRTKLIIDKKY